MDYYFQFHLNNSMILQGIHCLKGQGTALLETRTVFEDTVNP